MKLNGNRKEILGLGKYLTIRLRAQDFYGVIVDEGA